MTKPIKKVLIEVHPYQIDQKEPYIHRRQQLTYKQMRTTGHTGGVNMCSHKLA